ncbi:adenylyltransferase/cytidyltransferase family protein [Simkania negevensis]|uniref:Adenylyltransferase/cytidyltransferase family protein n=1 Tax=Simkania negevensis TaxID=83561 RepID=A0ABS3AR72_9BACT|nr:adenylyltransferase/cytidyltransferase family protein [Simkania negevensis]
MLSQPKLWKEGCRKKFISPSHLEEEAIKIKASGKTIATLNGSFDLLHAGHLQIIYEASQTADVLIVALNSDSSIQQYKNPNRPIIPLEYRLQMMAALAFVDYITWFDETNPVRFLKAVQPNVHVNGAEYGRECMEADTVKKGGGAVHIVELVPGLSTTQIMNKIRNYSETPTKKGLL